MVSPDPGVAEIETVPVEHLEALPADGEDGDELMVSIKVTTESHPLTFVPVHVAVLLDAV
jgi:hypothetical protein